MSETVASRLKRRIDERGISVRGLATASGVPESTIRNILEGNSENPRGDTIKKLAAALETTSAELNGDRPPATAVIQPPSDVRLAPVDVPTTFSLPKDMPVLGTAAGSELGRGAFQITPDVVDYVRRPPGLLGARDAYALYVEGESMSPRFEPGDLVFVHPHRKPMGGDYIIVQEPDTNNGEPRAFIKRMVKVTGSTLRVQQFNPPTTIDFVIRPGLVWHKVMTDADLYTF